LTPFDAKTDIMAKLNRPRTEGAMTRPAGEIQHVENVGRTEHDVFRLRRHTRDGGVQDRLDDRCVHLEREGSGRSESINGGQSNPTLRRNECGQGCEGRGGSVCDSGEGRNLRRVSPGKRTAPIAGFPWSRQPSWDRPASRLPLHRS
jgi:hypothetical protein